MKIQQILASDSHETMVDKINQSFVYLASLDGGPKGLLGTQGIPGLPGLQGNRGLVGNKGRTGTRIFFDPPPPNINLAILIENGTYAVGDTFIDFDIENLMYTFYEIIKEGPNQYDYQEHIIDTDNIQLDNLPWINHPTFHWSIIINNSILDTRNIGNDLNEPNNDNRKHFTFNTVISSTKNTQDYESLKNQTFLNSAQNEVLYWTKNHFKLSLDQKLPYNLDEIKGDDLNQLFANNFIYKDIISDEPQQYLNMWDSYSFGDEIDLGEIGIEESIKLDDFNIIKNTSPILYLQTDSTYFDINIEDIERNDDEKYSNFGFLIKRIDTGEESQVFKEENGRYKSVLILASDNNDDNDMYFKLKNIWSEGNFISEINNQNKKNNKRFYTPFVSKNFDADFYVDEDQYVYYGFGDYSLEKYDESEITNTRKFNLDSGLEFKIGFDVNNDFTSSSKLKSTKTTINTESTIERDSNCVMVWEYDKVGVNLNESPEETLHMNGNLRIDNGEIKIKYANNNFWNIKLNNNNDLKIISDNNKTLYIGSEEKEIKFEISGESTFNDNVKIVNSKLDVDKETTIKDNVKIVDSRLKIGENNNSLTSLHLDKDGSILAQDNDNEWDGGNLGTGTRLMWIPHKSAFRTGTLTTSITQNWWDSNNIGNFSFASGRNVKASGTYSIVLMNNSEANKQSSIAIGDNSISDEQFSVAMGKNAKAINIGSFIFADSQNSDFESINENEFRLRFDSGYDFQSGVVNFKEIVSIDGNTLNWEHINDKDELYNQPLEYKIKTEDGLKDDSPDGKGFDGSTEVTWEVDKDYINELYVNTTKDQTISSEVLDSIKIKDLLVKGNLEIENNIEAQDIYTKKDLIKLRNDNIEPISSDEISGLKIKNYDGNENDLLFGTNNDGWFKIGKTGDLQKIATIEDGAIDNKFVKYNVIKNRLETNEIKKEDTDFNFVWYEDNGNIYYENNVSIGSDDLNSDYKLEIVSDTSSLLQIHNIDWVDSPGINFESVLRFANSGNNSIGSGSAEIATIRTDINNIGDRNLSFRTGSESDEPTDKMIINYDGNIITKGLNWTDNNISGIPDKIWYSITYGDGLFVAVGDDAAMYSSDGINWIEGLDISNIIWRSVTYGNGLFVAVGTDTVMYSSDGINWTDDNVSGVLNEPWESITYGNGLFVAVGDSIAMYSSDGMNWYEGSNILEEHWRSVTYGNGLFVAVGDNATMYSLDGINWTDDNVSGVSDKTWYSVIYGNGLFVAVGDDAIIYSSDGIRWDINITGIPNKNWYSVIYGNGLFISVSDNEIIYSSDGINWSEVSDIPSSTWHSVTYGNGLFVALSNNTIIYSGKQYQNLIPHNTYHGGMKVTGILDINTNIISTGKIQGFSTSDIKLKKNIKSLENSLEIIDKLNPISFEWNETAQKLNKTKKENKEEYGLIAQETEKILPNIVNDIYNDQYKGIDYEKIIPFLIQYIKELKKQSIELEKYKNTLFE